MSPRTLCGELRRRAREAHASSDIALRFTDPTDSGPTEDWSTLRLWETAERVGRGLRASGVCAGDRVLVLSPEMRTGVAAHFGAWAIGATPVHVGLPFRLTDIPAFVAQLEHTAARLGATRLLLSPMIEQVARLDERVSRPLTPALPPDGARGPTPIGIRALLSRDDDESPLGDPDELPAPDLVQLTSGSTGQPRAVVIPHERLWTHLEAIAHALPAGENASGVTWLPLYHDMGLIGGLLYPLFTRFPVHLLSPLVFQTRPYVWLQALSEARATHTAGPPSAYALSLRLAERARTDGLRLDALRCAMIGAEPIAPELLRTFVEAFGPTGFRQGAFFPVYGLAEATVAVTFPEVLAPPVVARVDRRVLEHERRVVAPDETAPALELTGVGRPLPGTELRIVGDDGADCPEGGVGEIRVRAPTLMRAYDAEPEATSKVLVEGWLHTGDLGFLQDGVLFIAGRSKDVVIKGGQCIFPEPVESAASAVPGVRVGCVVVVGVVDVHHRTEQLVVVAETKLAESDHAALSRRLRDELKVSGVSVDRVLLVPPGWLPRTTSGKHRRREVAARLSAEPTASRASG